MFRMTRWFVGVWFLVITATGTFGATIVLDDFTDGDIADGDPATWRRVATSQWRYQDGDLNLFNNTTRENGGIALVNPLQGDLSIRTQMRVLGGGGGIASMYDLQTFDGYFAYASADGVFEVGVTAGGVDLYDTVDMPPVVGIDEDVIIQLDHFGDTLTAWYWLESDGPPSSPQVTMTLDADQRITQGYTGIWVSPGVDNPVQPSSIFRYVRIDDAPIPLPKTARLMPGDADQNLQFDQRDLVHVLVAGKYMTGLPATWGEGDWDAAPGGEPGIPPVGDGLFNHLDVITALAGGTYLTGPYGEPEVADVAVGMAAPVPEPAGIVLFMLGLPLLARIGSSMGFFACLWRQKSAE